MTDARSAAQAPGGTPRPKRFYRLAAVEPVDSGFALSLDGRRARTPGRAVLAVPTRALGEAIAAEWNAQAETIDPRAMPLTRLANSAVDGVAVDPEAVAADLVTTYTRRTPVPADPAYLLLPALMPHPARAVDQQRT